MIDEQLKKEWLESVGTEDALFDPEENAELLRRLRKPGGSTRGDESISNEG